MNQTTRMLAMCVDGNSKCSAKETGIFTYALKYILKEANQEQFRLRVRGLHCRL